MPYSAFLSEPQFHQLHLFHYRFHHLSHLEALMFLFDSRDLGGLPALRLSLQRLWLQRLFRYRRTKVSFVPSDVYYKR